MLHQPRGAGAGDRVMVLVHGGFWRWPFNRWVTSLLARDAARRGFVVYNIEYRRLGRFGGGGGWPETFDDVTNAVIAVNDRFAGSPTVIVGHSAGGHLALVAAARLAERVDGVVAMSAPTDLRALSRSGSAVVDELVADAPPEDRWSLTSPIEMLPTGIRTACVHGEADETVHPDMSVHYVRAALDAGDDARLVMVPGEGHRRAVVPSSATWNAALAVIDDWQTNCKKASRSNRCLTKDLG